MLGLTLLLLGRRDEAVEVAYESVALYPDDPNLKVLTAMLHATRGDQKKAQAAIREVSAQLTARQTAALEATVEMTFLGYQLEDDPEAVAARVLMVWPKLLPNLDAIWPVLSGKVSPDAEKGTAQLMMMPPMVSGSLKTVIQAMAGVVLNVADESNHRRLADALRAHPEGTLYFVYGAVLARAGRWSEAKLNLLTAANTPALARVRRAALTAALFCDLDLARRGDTYDADALRQALPQLRELMNMAPLRPGELLACVQVAHYAGELDLTRHLLAEWEQLEGPVESVLQYRMATEVKARNPVAALAAADRILRVRPNHPEALRVRAEETKNLQQLARATEKPMP
jgi:tetratricopeptide (TPR) repeat protein